MNERPLSGSSCARLNVFDVGGACSIRLDRQTLLSMREISTNWTVRRQQFRAAARNILADARSGAVTRLVLPGVPIGWFLGALACYYVAGLIWPIAILLAGILVVTGPTVVLPLLRQSNVAARPQAFSRRVSLCHGRRSDVQRRPTTLPCIPPLPCISPGS